MLRFIQNQAAESAKRYYSQSDYLSEGQEQAGNWGGKAAAMLGVSGTVGKREFDRLCDNLHPLTGKQLTPRTRFDRTIGYDINVHAPKGVSVAYLLLGDERIRDAFEQSFDETLAEMEGDARTRVRRGRMYADRVTGNLVCAGFTHLTGRPVDGVPDMHLHKHGFVFNVTWDDVEQTYKACQFREIKRDAPYFEAGFNARLAKRIAALGYTIERKGRNWDIAEVPQPVRDMFSRRTEQIEKLAKEKGIVDAAEKDKLGAKSREKKRSDLSMDELRSIWKERLSEDDRNTLAGIGTKEQAVPGKRQDARRRAPAE